MVDASALQAAISAVCPVDGVSVGNPADRTTWLVDFDPSATAAQQQAAQGVIASYQDPAPQRMATGEQLASALADLGFASAWASAVSAAKLVAQNYWSSAYERLIPENNPKIIKLCGVAGVSVAALFTKALTE